MAGTIVVCGYGPGISDAVARRFGREGFRVALVGRTAERVAAGARALEGAGIRAEPFPCDLGDPDAVRAMLRGVAEALGPATVIHWNAYVGVAGDLVSASVDELRALFDVNVVGLVAAVQEALPGMAGQPEPAVLVTGGGLALYDPQVDAMAVQWRAMGLAVGKAAQHKVTRLLHERLRPEGVYVGEVTVLGGVKGTAFDTGHATIEAADVADRFWQMYQERSEVCTQVA